MVRKLLHMRDTRCNTWFERDRAHVELTDADGRTILEWWDDEVNDAVEDGFLRPGDWHASAFEAARDVKLV